jgi:hypothetical protein
LQAYPSTASMTIYLRAWADELLHSATVTAWLVSVDEWVVTDVCFGSQFSDMRLFMPAFNLTGNLSLLVELVRSKCLAASGGR